MSENSIDQEKYQELFGIDQEELSEKLKIAFQHAREYRNFEIEMYWKRATYFWSLIAAAFAGYFVVLASYRNANDGDSRNILAFFIGCVGFVFTWAWFLVNKGSKQWQENWENHVDMLEDKVTGPLYKIMMRRPPHGDDDNAIEKYITNPEDFSVSKINQLVNVLTMSIWILLLYHVSNVYPIKNLNIGLINFEKLLALAVSLIFSFIMWKFGRTHGGSHNHLAIRRETKIVDKQSKVK